MPAAADRAFRAPPPESGRTAAHMSQSKGLATRQTETWAWETSSSAHAMWLRSGYKSQENRWRLHPQCAARMLYTAQTMHRRIPTLIVRKVVLDEWKSLTDSQAAVRQWQPKSASPLTRSAKAVFRNRLVSHFAHQGEQVSFGVAKERHPQIVRRHFRNQVRLVLEAHPARFQLAIRRLNVRHVKIQH